VFLVCDWLVNFILPLLSFFVVMFCFVLFCVWYCAELSWWLVAANIILIVCMVLVTVMFAIGSREIGFKMRLSRKSKNKARFPI
jgi:hypothetical protein